MLNMLVEKKKSEKSINKGALRLQGTQPVPKCHRRAEAEGLGLGATRPSCCTSE